MRIRIFPLLLVLCACVDEERVHHHTKPKLPTSSEIPSSAQIDQFVRRHPEWGAKYKKKPGYAGFVGTVIESKWLTSGQASKEFEAECKRIFGNNWSGDSKMPGKERIVLKVKKVLWKGEGRRFGVLKIKFDWLKVGEVIKYERTRASFKDNELAKKRGVDILPMEELTAGHTYMLVTSPRLFKVLSLMNIKKEIPGGSHR